MESNRIPFISLILLCLYFQLVIEIGTSHVSNQYSAANPQSTSSFFQEMTDPPLPHYQLPALGFCPHCGIARSNITAKYCSTCGQVFSA